MDNKKKSIIKQNSLNVVNQHKVGINYSTPSPSKTKIYNNLNKRPDAKDIIGFDEEIEYFDDDFNRQDKLNIKYSSNNNTPTDNSTNNSNQNRNQSFKEKKVVPRSRFSDKKWKFSDLEKNDTDNLTDKLSNFIQNYDFLVDQVNNSSKKSKNKSDHNLNDCEINSNNAKPNDNTNTNMNKMNNKNIMNESTETNTTTSSTGTRTSALNTKSNYMGNISDNIATENNGGVVNNNNNNYNNNNSYNNKNSNNFKNNSSHNFSINPIIKEPKSTTPKNINQINTSKSNGPLTAPLKKLVASQLSPYEKGPTSSKSANANATNNKNLSAKFNYPKNSNNTNANNINNTNTNNSNPSNPSNTKSNNKNLDIKKDIDHRHSFESACSNEDYSVTKFITSIDKKTKKSLEEEEEERCVMVKALTNMEDIKDFYTDTMEYLKRIPSIEIPSLKEISHLMVDLPFEKEFKSGKKLAVFDLDETLVHCEIRNPSKGEHLINVKLPNGNTTKIGLNIRPLVNETLEKIKKNYVIIIYTASHQSYADSVLDFLDPCGKMIQYRLYRHNCVKAKVDGECIYVKDMRIFRNIHPKNITIVDNSVLSFAFQLDNGIPILPFYNNKDDYELDYLSSYLNLIWKGADLREENKKMIKLDYFLDAAIKDESLCISEEEWYESSDESSDTPRNDNVPMISLNLCGEDNEGSSTGREDNGTISSRSNLSARSNKSHKSHKSHKSSKSNTKSYKRNISDQSGALGSSGVKSKHLGVDGLQKNMNFSSKYVGGYYSMKDERFGSTIKILRKKESSRPEEFLKNMSDLKKSVLNKLG